MTSLAQNRTCKFSPSPRLDDECRRQPNGGTSGRYLVEDNNDCDLEPEVLLDINEPCIVTLDLDKARSNLGNLEPLGAARAFGSADLIRRNLAGRIATPQSQANMAWGVS